MSSYTLYLFQNIESIMKHLLIIIATLLVGLSLHAQDDNSTIIEKESTMTKEVQVEEEDGMLNVRIVTTDGEGNKEVTVWKGTADDEDIPEDVKIYVLDGDEIKVEVNGDERVEKKQIRLKVLDEDGNEKLLEWDGEGEMPAEMKKLMDEKGYDIDRNTRERRGDMREKHMEVRKQRQDDGYGAIPEFRGRAHKHRYGGQAKFGVKIDDSSGVVEVAEVMDKSAADRGGMEDGDIIVVVDDTDIDSLNRLYAELATHNPGDKVKVTVKRDGKKKSLSIVLD